MAKRGYGKRIFLVFLFAILFIGSAVNTKLRYEAFQYNPKVVAFKAKVNGNPTFLELRDNYEVWKEKLNENDNYHYVNGQLVKTYAAISPYVEIANHHLTQYQTILQTKVYEPINSIVVVPATEKLLAVFNANVKPHIDAGSAIVAGYYNQYLAQHVDKAAAISNDVYVRSSPHIAKYSGIFASYVKRYTLVATDLLVVFLNDFAFPAIQKTYIVVSEKLYRWNIQGRILYYRKVAPNVKRGIRHLNHVLIPEYYQKFQDFLSEVALPKTLEIYYSTIEISKLLWGRAYNAYIGPATTYLNTHFEHSASFFNNHLLPQVIGFHNGVIKPSVRKSISVTQSSANIAKRHYIGPAAEYLFSHINFLYQKHLEPFLLNEKNENVVTKFFSAEGVIFVTSAKAYSKLLEYYYAFLTEDPLDAEIERLSSLLNKYATSTFLTGLGTDSILAAATSIAASDAIASEATPYPSAQLEAEPIKYLKPESSLTPVQKQVDRWHDIVKNTCDGVIEDFNNEFLQFEEDYAKRAFQPLLEENLRSFNDFINEGYIQLQKFIRDIDTVDVFLNNENFIINEEPLKENTKSEDSQDELKFFSHEYPDGASDSQGLNYTGYLELVDEISYINDLNFNKTLLKKAEDPTFEDRDFYLNYVKVGKDIEVSQGEVIAPALDSITEDQLFTPGEYLYKSNLVHKLTINKNTRNVINKISRKVVRDKFTEIRQGIEFRANNLKNIIENGFAEVLEEFNSLKFRNLDIFENFSDIVLDEWDSKFMEYLERDPVNSQDEDDESFLFDIDSVKEQGVLQLDYDGEDKNEHGNLERRNDESNQIESFYESKRDLYNSELDKKKKQQVTINHKKNWQNFKEFFKIKETLLKTRGTLNSLEPDLQPTHAVASVIDQTIGILISESQQYLDILRAQANLAFQFREEYEKQQRIRRFYKYNGYPVLTEEEIQAEQEKQRLEQEEKAIYDEKVRKSEEKRLSQLTVLLDGKPNDEGYIQAKLERPKDPEEIIPELENENIEYYYDDDGFVYDGYEDYDLVTSVVTNTVTVGSGDSAPDTATNAAATDAAATDSATEVADDVDGSVDDSVDNENSTSATAATNDGATQPSVSVSEPSAEEAGSNIVRAAAAETDAPAEEEQIKGSNKDSVDVTEPAEGETLVSGVTAEILSESVTAESLEVQSST